MPLQRDHVHYLIWRYLQEIGFDRSAAEFQRQWDIGNPQEALPFVGKVKYFALVNLLQDAVHYDAVRSGIDADRPRKYEFIEGLSPAIAAPPRAGSPTRVNGSTPPARLPLDSAANEERGGPGDLEPRSGRDEMDVDVTPPPRMIKEPEPVPTTVLGTSTGCQTLGPYQPSTIDTLVSLDVADDADVIDVAWLKPLADGQEERLVATGIGHWRSYNLPAPEQRFDEPQLSSREVDFGKFVITSAATDSSCSKLALGIEQHGSSTQLIVTESGRQERTVLAKIPGAVLCLRWSPKAMRLFCTSATPVGLTTFTIFDVLSRAPLAISTRTTAVEDAAWIDETRLLLCGWGVLKLVTLTPDSAGGIANVTSLATDGKWSKIQYDCVMRRACCMSHEAPYLVLLSLDGPGLIIHSEAATRHTPDRITDFAWQPTHESCTEPHLPSSEPATDMDIEVDAPDRPSEHPAAHEGPRILATACTDGTVSLWNARHGLAPLRALEMWGSVPALGLVFSADGRHVAASGADRVCIWAVDEGPQVLGVDSAGKPLAVWRRGDAEDDARRPIALADVAMEISPGGDADGEGGDGRAVGEPAADADVCLSWNPAGTRLVYNTGKRLIIIDTSTLQQPHDTGARQDTRTP